MSDGYEGVIIKVMKILLTIALLILSFPSIAEKRVLPKENVTVSLPDIEKICQDFELPELWEKIAADPPMQPFQSDGCTAWFDQWQGKDLYPACFKHDLYYWAGYPDESIARLRADTELMLDVAIILNNTAMAETMFHGVRLGGDGPFKTKFSWGFGRR